MKLFLTLLFCSILPVAFGQPKSDQAKADSLGRQAVTIMDEGQLEASIVLLKQAQALDPEHLTYPYEIAYARYVQEDYPASIDILEGLTDHKDVTDHVYQLLGNAYDLIGEPEQAMEMYAAGRKKFPDSGKLYLEAGVILYGQEKYNEAVAHWESGIEAEPNFPSNYYWLAKLFVHSKERVWMLLYAEMFLNLERNTARTEEISELLYENYQQTYTWDNDTSGEFHLTEKGFEIVIRSKKEMRKLKKGKKSLLPFEGTYAMTYTMAALPVLGGGGFDLDQLDQLRGNFLDTWFEKGHQTQYPYALFVYLRKIQAAGHWEAYNHWLLSMGNPEEFDIWYDTHKEAYEAFGEWYNPNYLVLGPKDWNSRREEGGRKK